MYNYTEEQLKNAKSVCITCPGFGTIFMDVKKVHDGYVEGLVWNDTDMGSPYMPDGYMGQDEWMNFPISYVKKIS